MKLRTAAIAVPAGFLAVICFDVCAFEISKAFTEHGYAEIRMDSGDLRYWFWDFLPLRKRMPRQQRAWLMKVAGEEGVPAQWCGHCKLSHGRYEGMILQECWEKIARLAETDEMLARAIHMQTLRWARDESVKGGIPECIGFLFYLQENQSNGGLELKPDWKYYAYQWLFCTNLGANPKSPLQSYLRATYWPEQPPIETCPPGKLH